MFLTLVILIYPKPLKTVQAAGNTYYVAKTGSDSATCTQAQSVNTPKLTIGAGLLCLSGGDTLIIKVGTYTEGIEGNAIPSGISNGQRTIVQAAAGETVIINGANSSGYTVTIENKDYITLDGIIFDGANATVDRAVINMGTRGATGDPGVHYITVQNGIVRRMGANSLDCIETHGYPSGLSSNLVFKNLEVYGCGSSRLYHGIYLNSRDSIVEDSVIHDNAFGHGIHIYSSDGTLNASNNVFRNNRIYGNGSFCIGLYSGSNNIAYNNLCYGNGGNTGSGGIRTDYGSVNAKIYNNTIYNNSGNAIWIGAGAANTIVQNNIGWANGSDGVRNEGTATIVSNNLFTDPSFVNSAAADFHLQSTSPAINAGVALSEVTTDYDGVSRPQGSAYDIGAYEYVGSAPVDTTPPSAPTGVRVQ